jgi:hypothetical protein
MVFLSIVLCLYTVRFLTLNPIDYSLEQRASFVAHSLAITTHVAGAMVAAIIGPFQFLPKIVTKRYLSLHRWLGRTYLAGVLVGGSGGLYMASVAYGGLPARLGFGMLAVAWVASGLMAYRRIRHKEI